MARTLHEIPSLLHEARLSDCRWDHRLKALHLSFHCLRRNTDGTPIEDTTVELRLDGVESIVGYYSPANVTVKPSEFVVNARITIADLEEWPHRATEAHIAVNSLQLDFDLATSCVQETILGEQGQHPRESELRIHISFEPTNYRDQAASSSLFIACDSMEPFTNGVPLDIELWHSQFEAWWKGWRDHWSEKVHDHPHEAEPAPEDTFIPAGMPDPPDLSYRPPSAAPFQLVATTAPKELLKPIEDYHNGLHDQDWLTLASAYPHFDQDLEERAARLKDQFLLYDHGRWVYVRRIDDWWCEGNRACVVVRGIEHVKGDYESPARNEETVISYGLRKCRDTWVIWSWSQGWPRFGSAELLHEFQSWRDRWELGG